MSKTRKSVVALCLAVSVLSVTVAPAALAGSQNMPAASLYKRLGGYDAIALVTDDFIGRLAAEPQLARFLVGLSTDSKMHLRQMVVDQICAATGGPCVYIGRSMKTAHAGLGITERDWQLSVDALVASLDRFKVGQKEKEELLAAVSTMKADIVEKP